MVNNAQRIQFLIDQEDGFTKARLPALYSDFRSLRAANPDGYAINAAAWRRALAALVRGGMLPAAASQASPSSSKDGNASSSTAARSFLILTAGEPLLDALHSDRYKRPMALQAVIDEAVQDHDFLPLDGFLRAKDSIYNRTSWAKWAVGAAVGLPWHALSWGLRQAGVIEGSSSGVSAPASYCSGSSGKRLLPNQYVVLANVEEAASAFVDKMAAVDAARASPFERVWSVAQFKRTFAAAGAVLDDTHMPIGATVQQPSLSDIDLDVLLAFMARDKKVVVYDGHVVKLRPATPTSGSANADVITEEDRAVAQLRELIDSLTHQTSVLSSRIDDLTAAAKDAVMRNNRVGALAALKQKKQAESALAARFASLGQLEATAAKLEQASDQVQVVAAMAASADALEVLNAQVGGTSGVEGVVDRLRDQMEAADEIGRILVEGGASSTVLDEGEIDDELAALEQQEVRKVEAARTAVEKAAKTAAEAAAEAAAAEAAAEAEARKAEDAAAEETRQRLASAGTVPTTTADLDAVLETMATDSFRNLSLDTEEPQQVERAQ